MTDLLGFIDGPGHHLQPRVMGLFDNARSDQVAARHQLPGTGAHRALDQISRRVLAKEPRHQSCIHPVQGIQRGRIER